MADAWHHAVSSARKFGGTPDDYYDIHRWFDATKQHLGNFRHRALRHHTQGIVEAESVFGPVIVLSNDKDKTIPLRLVAEQHIKEDCGFLPTIQDWLGDLPFKDWMLYARPIEKTETKEAPNE